MDSSAMRTPASLLGSGYNTPSLFVAGAGPEGRVECVPRNPERLEIGIGEDAVEELRGGHVVPVPCAAVLGPHEDGVLARPLGIDQPEVLVGPFGGAPEDQPLAARRVDRNAERLLAQQTSASLPKLDIESPLQKLAQQVAAHQPKLDIALSPPPTSVGDSREASAEDLGGMPTIDEADCESEQLTSSGANNDDEETADAPGTRGTDCHDRRPPAGPAAWPARTGPRHRAPPSVSDLPVHSPRPPLFAGRSRRCAGGHG